MVVVVVDRASWWWSWWSVGVAGDRRGGTVMVLASRVTAAVWARIRPCTVAVESSVAEVSAIRVPTKVLPEPKVAELPTVQKTLQALAPFSSSTTLPDAVTRLEEAWKMKHPTAVEDQGAAAVMLAVDAGRRRRRRE